MKKRIVAFLLSLTLCMATVVEAGAAAEIDVFSSEPAVAEEVVVEEEPQLVTDDIVVEEPAVTPEAEIPAETPDLTVEPTEDDIVIDENIVVDQEIEEAPVPTVEPETEEVPVEDLFSAGEAVQDVPTEEVPQVEEPEEELISFIEEEVLDAAGAMELADGEVLETDWEKNTDGTWKLKKRVPEENGIEEAALEPTGEAFEAEPAEEISVVVEEAEQTNAGEAEQEYYKNCFVEIKTVKETAEGGKEIVAQGWYLFNEYGLLVTGRKVIASGTEGYTGAANTEYFFMNAANATLKNSADKVATPVNSNLGQMQKNYNWLWEAGAFHNYGSNGAKAVIAANKVYNINGNLYFLLADGKPYTGLKDMTYNGVKGTYCFDKNSVNGIPGRMVRNSWAHVGTDKKKGDRYFFFQSNGTRKKMGIVCSSVLSAKNYYLVDANGYLIKNKMQKASDGYYYLTNKSGVVYREKLVKYGKYRYYFTSTGKRATWKNRWKRCPGAGNRYYYFGKTAGRVVEKKKWQKVTEKGKFIGWFYFSSKGNHYINKWSNRRYFLPDGRLASGIKKVGQKYYFFERSTKKQYKGKTYKTTWIKDKGKWYYAVSTGALYNNRWKQINRVWYYFQSDCSVKTNSKAVRAGIHGYLDSRGKFSNGWVVVNANKNKVRYMDPKTGEYYKNTSAVIDGLTYFFDSKGYRISDVTKTKYFAQYKGKYYLECDRQNGVMTVFNANRTVPLKTIRVSVGNPITLTRTGTFTLNRAGRWQALMGPSWGQYGTHVNGGIYVHSVACSQANSYNLPAGEYNKLGSPASHGCIRCCVADAKWVWDNCHKSKIKIFDGVYESSEAFKGPLGRNPLTKLRGSMNFDPTDPAV